MGPCPLLDEALNRAEIVGEHGDALRIGHQGGEAGRQGGALAGDRLHGVGELRGMRGGERDMRDVPGLGGHRLARRDDGAGAMRVQQVAALRLDAADAVGDGGLVDALGDEALAVGHDDVGEADRAALLQAVHLAAHEGGVAAGGLEQEALEVGGDLDVHGRRRGGDHVGQRVHAGLPRAVEDVVLVGGDRPAAPVGRPMRLAA